MLLADDRREIRALVAKLLSSWGAQPVAVENGQLAVDELTRADQLGQPYDLLLVDMEMPVLDGPGAVRLLRQNGHRLPVIALTANVDNWTRDDYLKIGCDDVVNKPVNADRLLAVIVAAQP